MKWVILGLLVSGILALCGWMSRRASPSSNGYLSGSGSGRRVKTPSDSTVSAYRRQTREHHHLNEE